MPENSVPTVHTNPIMAPQPSKVPPSSPKTSARNILPVVATCRRHDDKNSAEHKKQQQRKSSGGPFQVNRSLMPLTIGIRGSSP
jgi:hypothetical protein